MTDSRKILISSALPYANGSLHLGNMVEFIQTDIWVRFQKMRGHDVLYICGSDAHGTPVMLKAQRLNISPEELVTQFSQQQQQDLAEFGIEFDNFYTTHSPENQQLSALIYQRLQQNGDITKRKIEQAYDPVKEMFLPDRFVKGVCPRCQAKDQYGDSCDNCGATYAPTELIDPISAVSGATPITKESEHYFFDLQNYDQALQQWTRGEHLQPQVANLLEEWFAEGLQAWDISRDAPYFGFEIPDAPGKYFYVWLDAPVGYMASLKNLSTRDPNINFDDYWGTDSQAELYHFIGKDIVYFHSLFWPAMLMGAKLRTPTAIFVHGFLTIDGQKMSKSRGTFVKARTYLDHLEAEYLRYYFAAKLSSGTDDIDFNYQDFISRVNADLVGKVINIASRCAKFINQYNNNQLSAKLPKHHLLTTLMAAGDDIAQAYEKREYSRAMREVMQLADQVNQYIDEQKPWVLIKESDKQQAVQDICSLGLNCFRLLILYLKPVLPQLAQRVENFLQIPELTWKDKDTMLCDHVIASFQPLMQRIDKTKLAAMQKATEHEAASEQTS